MENNNNIDSHQHSNLDSLGTAEVRMRCPKCYKLYAVEAKTIASSRPEFDCVKCDQRFWVSFPEVLDHSEVVAFPMEWNESYKDELGVEDIVQSPMNDELDESLVKKISEDVSQVFDKIDAKLNKDMKKVNFIEDEISEEDIELNSEFWFLEKSWEKVINNYSAKNVHKEFIHAAKSRECLDFAYLKYKNFCDANPHDGMAHEMKTYSEKLMQEQAIHRSILGTQTKTGFKKYLKYLPWAALCFAAVLIGIGFSNEGPRDLLGFGFALIFLTGALSLLKESDL